MKYQLFVGLKGFVSEISFLNGTVLETFWGSLSTDEKVVIRRLVNTLFDRVAKDDRDRKMLVGRYLDETGRYENKKAFALYCGFRDSGQLADRLMVILNEIRRQSVALDYDWQGMIRQKAHSPVHLAAEGGALTCPHCGGLLAIKLEAKI